MTKTLYIGNLSASTTEAQILDLFVQVGEIESITLISDQNTGQFMGFGFVEMKTESATQEAVIHFNGSLLDGKILVATAITPSHPAK